MTKAARRALLGKLPGIVGVGLVAIATLALALLLGPMGGAVPALALLILFLLSELPLRYPIWLLSFLLLVLDNPADTGPWKSPLFIAGQALAIQLKWTIPVSALVLTGADTLLLGLFLMHWWRKVRSNPIDARNSVPVPRELGYVTWLAIIGTIIPLIWGVLHGGQLKWANWQMDRTLHLPLWSMFFGVVLRGRRDVQTAGRLIVVAALIRAIAAIGVRFAYPATETATSHADSILFAVATMILLITVLEGPTRQNFTRAGMLLPLLAWGMVANDRRIVWANVLMASIFLFFLSRWSRIKFKLVRAGVLSIPVGALYILAGWNSGSKIFKPVATIRSMVDAKSDASSNWREVENYDLHYTFLENPLLGTGWGRPFVEIQPLPEVPYDLEPYVPHNSILGLWAFTGFVGFTCIWMLLAATMYFALIAYRRATHIQDRVATLSIAAALIVCMLQAFGDMGLGSWPWTIILGMGVPLAGKLAIETGAWPRSRGT